ncbi:MAG: Mur ligase family protein [Coriobacteriia bacterium]|nr:Mur ligase family protein [Methylobacter sp.]MDP2429754.1 Mur ligase family protein [Methylobacter sp.]MDP3053194.1 Mur ligase family protein [Methylobacter sp.]MDP3363366.1 Mur ligase family protein [Methylobacter sp.]MDZ4169208.1 Mur ligase family protein [Coriobacteriia bacterium]
MFAIDESAFFSAQQLAEITQGTWENLSGELTVKKFHYVPKYIEPGDLLVIRHEKWPNKKYLYNLHKVPDMVAKGIVAIMANMETPLNVHIPILRVSDTYQALRKIAIRTSKLSTAKRILVVGSYGKTAFKTHLWHLLKEHLPTYTCLNSSNFNASTYCDFASLKRNTEVFVLEKPIEHERKILRRVKIIAPDIVVLTSIGHEHIEKFKTIDHIIWLKTTYASGLAAGGKFIAPYDSEYYPQILAALQRYPGINILTFGSGANCHARLLAQRFRQFGWDIVAAIEGEIIRYRVPFPEAHAPTASLAELLCVYHLGIDVKTAVAHYYQCTNFKSSGALYHIHYQNKHFYLYDQSRRGGIEGYSSFFKTVAAFQPEAQGKKIVVTSNFVDHVDGEVALLDLAYFKQLIADADIHCLFSVEYFTEHGAVVPDNVIWEHRFTVADIQEAVLNSLENDDILCVKGIYESDLPRLLRYLKQLPGLRMKRLVSRPWEDDDFFELSDVHEIT